MKKAVSLFLTLALLCTLLGGLSLTAHAEDDSGTWGSLTWRVENNVLTISGTGEMPDITSGTSQAWQKYAEKISSVVIESGVTSIGANAFYRARMLSSVTIPGTVRTIGDSAFQYCTALNRIELPEGVVSLGDYCFNDNSFLMEIKLPSTLESMGFACFSHCGALKEIELPASLKTMGDSVFDYCTSLETVRFGSGLTVLPGNAFANCGKLTQVVLPDTLVEIEYGAFKECSELEHLDFPGTLEVIGQWAFERTYKLLNVDLPASVREIRYDAFRSVSNRTITIRNPECDIAPDEDATTWTLGYSPTVVGYEGSTAQAYAQKHNFTFVLLNGCDEGRHTFTQVEVLTPPTCQTEGERRLTCQFCGETKTEPIPVVDHNDVLLQILQAPTYFEEGRALYGCSMCGRSHEDKMDKLNPGYLYQEVLYDRDDWSGAYLLGGYTFNYFYDGSAALAGIKFLSPKLTPSYEMTLTERFDVFGVQPNTAEYAFVLDKQSDGSYTIRSYWTGQYLARNGTALTRQDNLNQYAKWNVFVDNEGYFVIGSTSAPAYQLLYNEAEGSFQLLDTYTYEGTTYEAEKIFGIWLYEPDPCANFLDVDPRAWYHEGIDFAVSSGLFNGVSYNRFGVDSTMTRAMFVTVLWRLQGSPEVEGGKTFTDVPAGTWYSDAVAWASSQGIVNGTSETTFTPDAGITREQMAVLMYRYAQWLQLPADATGTLSGFPDAAKVSGYAADALIWATKLGIVTGTTAGNSVILKPQGNATRAQVATILMRFILAYL